MLNNSLFLQRERKKELSECGLLNDPIGSVLAPSNHHHVSKKHLLNPGSNGTYNNVGDLTDFDKTKKKETI